MGQPKIRRDKVQRVSGAKLEKFVFGFSVNIEESAIKCILLLVFKWCVSVTPISHIFPHILFANM